LLLAGTFPAVGEAVSRLSWALALRRILFVLRVLTFSLALQGMLGALMNWRVLEPVKSYFKIVALLLYSVALQKVKIKTLKRKEYNKYDQ
jgi:hypothetical protein